ncbi:MAG: ATP-binding protein [Planctomycetaceae bacterium]
MSALRNPTDESADSADHGPTMDAGGNLQIGDQWNAITILAHSQTHPLKAVCELTENAIDAGAMHVEFQRFRKGGDIWLQITDDGGGVVLNEDGLPNFRHIATHICDSMKRKLDEAAKKNIHGEYGIGLLSFWTLGKELRMASPDRFGSYHEMFLKRGEQTYSVRALGPIPELEGTRILLGPLLDSTRQVVTGEKIQKFLAAELRDRIRTTNAQIHILDKVARKDLTVSPREYEGIRLDLPETIATPHGEVSLELYLAPVPGERGAEIALCKDGTRVLNHIGELLHFEGPPWNDGRLCGMVDYPHLRLAPGTRQGVVPDQYLDHFVTAVSSVTQQLSEILQQRTVAETEEASRRIQLKVHKALKTAILELPDNDYLFFDLPGTDRKKKQKDSSDSAAPAVVDVSPVGSRRILPFEPGPLKTVTITPRSVRRRPGEASMLKAHATDDDQFPILRDIDWEWRIVEGSGSLTPDGNRCQVVSDDRGAVLVEVRATQGTRTVSDQVRLRYMDSTMSTTTNRRKGLPSYRLTPQPDSQQRSYYDRYTNEIVINSSHKDFVDSNTSSAKHRRYIGKLYAKEVVLLNFPDAPPATVAERLIELMVRTEENL